MISLKQFGSFEFKKQVNNIIGIKPFNVKDSNEWYWSIDESIFDLNDLKQKIPNQYSEYVEKFEKEFEKINVEQQAKVLNFSELSNFIKEKGYNSKQLFTIEADVDRTTSDKDFDNYYLELIFDNDKYRNKKILAIVDSEFMPEYDVQDKKIKATGYIFFNKNQLEFQFLVKREIEIMGLSTQLSEISKLRKICESNNWIVENNTQKNSLDLNFKNVGLIANEDTKGYKDFMHFIRLNKQFIIFENIKFNAQNIVQAIKKFNYEQKCQVICIVRGGGSPYDLYDFSDINLLEAIATSKIPIVMGIGHKGDNLLCGDVAKYNANTPTGAAEFINYLIGRKQKNIRDTKQKTEKEILNERINDLEEYIEYLQEKIEELETELERKNSKGFLNRLFNI